MLSVVKIDNSWKNFPSIKSAIWAKASSIGHEQWEGGFLSTGHVFCDLDNITMRPVDIDPTQARPRITVEAPLIFNGNASAATIAIYNSQLATYQIFIKATQELKKSFLMLFHYRIPKRLNIPLLNFILI
jgi:hypothetical protein